MTRVVIESISSLSFSNHRVDLSSLDLMNKFAKGSSKKSLTVLVSAFFIMRTFKPI